MQMHKSRFFGEISPTQFAGPGFAFLRWSQVIHKLTAIDGSWISGDEYAPPVCHRPSSDDL